jgi:hypothetical protein
MDVTMLPAYCVMLEGLGYITEVEYSDAKGQKELAEAIHKADAKACGVPYQMTPALKELIDSIEDCCATSGEKLRYYTSAIISYPWAQHVVTASPSRTPGRR